MRVLNCVGVVNAQQTKDLEKIGVVSAIWLENKELFEKLSENIKDGKKMKSNAIELLHFCKKNKFDCIHLPIGSPAQQFAIGEALKKGNIKVVFSYFKKASVDKLKPDGTTKKEIVQTYIGLSEM